MRPEASCGERPASTSRLRYLPVAKAPAALGLGEAPPPHRGAPARDGSHVYRPIRAVLLGEVLEIERDVRLLALCDQVAARNSERIAGILFIACHEDGYVGLLQRSRRLHRTW